MSIVTNTIEILLPLRQQHRESRTLSKLANGLLRNARPLRLSAHMLFLILYMVLCCDCLSALSATSDTSSVSSPSESHESVIEKQIAEFIHQYFEKAKITRKDRKIHIEYKSKSYLTLADRQELGPDSGGIVGDLEFREGRYRGKTKLPLTYTEQASYSVVLMAPYLARQDCHLYTKFAYAADTPPDFVEKFTRLLNGLGEEQSSRGAGSGDNEDASKRASGQATAAIAGQPSRGTDSQADSKNQDDNAIADGLASMFTGPGTSTEGITEKKQSRGFLWKATRGKDTVYILGTIHGAIAKFYPLPTEIDQAFDKSKHLMVEIAIDKSDPLKASKFRQQLGLYTPPDHLSKHLSPETKRVFQDYLNWSGESWAMYEKYRPWFVAETASQSKRWRGEDFRSSLGLDLYFIGRAREEGKAISDLETVEQQLSIDASLSEPAQDKLLQSSLLSLKELNHETTDLLDAWKSGDAEKMESLSTHHYRKYPELREYEKRLLDDRNVGMVAKVQQLMKVKPGPHFVAVGAAHLVGQMGLVKLFKQAGFDVEQVSSSAPAAPVAQTPVNTVTKQSFPEGFRMWFPVEPRRIVDGGTTRFEVYEVPFGCYIMCIITAPTDPSEWGVPGPLMLDRLVTGFKPVSKRSITRQGYPGREVKCNDMSFAGLKFTEVRTPAEKPGASSHLGKGAKTVAAKGYGQKAGQPAKKSAPFDGFLWGKNFAVAQTKDWKADIRAYLVGRKVFLPCAFGTKEFLASDNVLQWFDSLEFTSN